MQDSYEPQAAQAHLHRLWTEQLYREYDNLLYQYGLPLHSASVRVEALGARWGVWDPALRTISLNCALIERYPWDVVVEVLKHEVAHQVVAEMFGVREQHGPAFQRACKLLAVADWAAQASGELPEKIVTWRDRAVSEHDERLLKKVEKLLSLATSSNEHEALSAMQRVREIYARHNVQPAAQAPDLVSLVFGRKKKRIDRAESLIFSLLVEHFFVRAIFGHQYDAQDCCKYRVVEIMGTRHNVLMAEYVYHFLLQQVTRLWRSYQAAHGLGGGAKMSYMVGVLAGFSQKLQRDAAHLRQVAAQEVGVQQSQALVCAADARLEDYMSSRHPRLQTRSLRGGSADSSSYHAGVAAGSKLVLHKGITDAAPSRGRLLKGR